MTSVTGAWIWLWRSPLMAAAIARAMPVLPEVASMRVSPGLMSPFRSASWIMLMAGLRSQYDNQIVSALHPYGFHRAAMS